MPGISDELSSSSSSSSSVESPRSSSAPTTTPTTLKQDQILATLAALESNIITLINTAASTSLIISKLSLTCKRPKSNESGDYVKTLKANNTSFIDGVKHVERTLRPFAGLVTCYDDRGVYQALLSDGGGSGASVKNETVDLSQDSDDDDDDDDDDDEDETNETDEKIEVAPSANTKTTYIKRLEQTLQNEKNYLLELASDLDWDDVDNNKGDNVVVVSGGGGGGGLIGIDDGSGVGSGSDGMEVESKGNSKRKR